MPGPPALPDMGDLVAAAAPSGSFDLHDLARVLLVGSAVLVVCIAAVRVTARSGLPTLLAYLGVGLLLGTEGLGIPFDSELLAQVLGYCALILILTEGGLTTRWQAVRPSVLPALSLSTVGVVVSVLVTAAAAHLLLGLDWDVAMLIAAILSSTDAAAVFSVLRKVPLPRRLSGMLEAESGFNDAPVVLLVVALSERLVDGSHAEAWWSIGVRATLELLGGALVGIVVGYVGGQVVRRAASATSGLFSIGVISVSVLAYASAASVHASGFMACFVASLVMGNMAMPHRSAMTGFAESVGWLAQIGLFVMLGLLATPSQFPAQVLPALVLGLVLLLVARPVSVVVSLLPTRASWQDQAFLSWAGLRGAVPVVLATVPVTMGAQGVDWIFDLVFVLVVIFTIVQAPTLPWLARRLGVVQQGAATQVVVESVPLDELGAELLEIRVDEGSRLSGVEVFELRLPKGANVSLVVRETESFVPTPQTIIRAGDQLLVVCTRAVRDAVERRMRAVSEEGRLAGWRLEPPEAR